MKLMEQDIEYDTYFAFTVQEEIGSRGSVVVANRIKPGVCLVIEGTSAADLPEIENGRRSTALGGGAAVSLFDQRTIYDTRLREKITSLADEAGIKWQYRTSSNGANDAGSIHISGTGALAFGLSVPVRYIHSANNVAYFPDVEEVFKLAKLFINETGEYVNA